LNANSEQRKRLDEKYKADLNERNTRTYEQTAALKRDHQDSLNALHKQLESNRAELTKVITQYEDKQREEDETHQNRLTEQLNIYHEKIAENTQSLNAFQAAKSAEVADLTAHFDAERRDLQDQGHTLMRQSAQAVEDLDVANEQIQALKVSIEAFNDMKQFLTEADEKVAKAQAGREACQQELARQSKAAFI
jgi:hypothetical protein